MGAVREEKPEQSGEEEYSRMNVYELTAPCHFGLEAVLKKEIIDLGYEVSQVEDGRTGASKGGKLPGADL